MNDKLKKAITIALLTSTLTTSSALAAGLSDNANEFSNSNTSTTKTNTIVETASPKVENTTQVSNQDTNQNISNDNAPVSEPKTTAAAPSARSFSDVKSNAWYHGVVMNLVGRGGIGGYPDGTFAPNKGITKGEFLKIAYISATGDSGKVAGTGKHWASGVLESAIEKGIVREVEIKATELNQPITRNEMARILVRLAEYKGESQVDTSKVASVMGDYGSVSQEHKYYVEQAYMKGLIAGMDSQGNFVGGKGGTRAEASAMIVRLLQENERVAVKEKEAPVGGRTISLTDPKRPLVPKEGDIIIKADGTKVVLKKGSGGVLGAAQGVDYYSGITFDNGSEFKEGELGSDSMGYMGQPYIIDKYGEGHSYMIGI